MKRQCEGEKRVADRDEKRGGAGRRKTMSVEEVECERAVLRQKTRVLPTVGRDEFMEEARKAGMERERGEEHETTRSENSRGQRIHPEKTMTTTTQSGESR